MRVWLDYGREGGTVGERSEWRKKKLEEREEEEEVGREEQQLW